MAMLRPTYMALIANANKDVKEGETPVVTSRYSIVLAAAKRARQIISEEPELIDAPDAKALSVAINELYTDQVKIISDGE